MMTTQVEPMRALKMYMSSRPLVLNLPACLAIANLGVTTPKGLQVLDNSSQHVADHHGDTGQA